MPRPGPGGPAERNQAETEVRAACEGQCQEGREPSPDAGDEPLPSTSSLPPLGTSVALVEQQGPQIAAAISSGLVSAVGGSLGSMDGWESPGVARGALSKLPCITSRLVMPLAWDAGSVVRHGSLSEVEEHQQRPPPAGSPRGPAAHDGEQAEEEEDVGGLPSWLGIAAFFASALGGDSAVVETAEVLDEVKRNVRKTGR